MARLRSIGRYSVEDQTVGKGNFAVVELATHTVTKTKVALKVIDKRKISKPYVKKNMTREARIMSQLRHPNIVRLYETITSPHLYCLVMEYVPGGDLLTLVRGQKGGRLKEGVARRFVRQLVSALHHMHEHGIVHRDLKMENIMMDKKRENVKIIDFGLSNQCGPDELFKTHCGSPEYAAPELYVAGRDYGPEVDIWSLGVNMFAMVTGKLPFTTPHSENRRQHLLLQIRKGLKGVHDKEMAHLTDDCKDLLHGCIEPIPEDRLPLLDIEGHAWITCEGQEPFSPYQAPPLDLDLRAEIIEEMALRLKVYPEKIQDVVQENKLDDVSAIFNILMEDALVKRGMLADDHTRPPTPQVPMESTRPNSGRRDGSRASSARPGSAFTEISDGVRTPTVVTMVRPSLKSPEKKSKKIVDFELDVLDSEQSSWAQRTGMQNGLPPRWTKISRPLGNATTANRVKARTSYRTGNPGTFLIPSDQEYTCEKTYEKTDLLHASTIHILVPTPSFESQPTSQPTSQAELDVVNPPNAPRSKSPVKVDAKIGRAPPGGSATQKKYKPITKVRLSYFGSTQEKKERAKTEPKLAPKEKPKPIPSASADDENVDKVKEVNVVDLSTNFEAKRQTYHGYHVGETPITTKGETEPKCTLKEKPKPIPCADDGNVDKVKEVNVVDLSTNFEAKRQSYHGYRVGETPITTKGETSETVDSKRAESGKHKTKEVRVCVAHREFFEDGQKSSGRPAATPYSSPRKQNNHNEPNVALSAKRYPLLQESSEQATKSDDLTTQSEDASTPTPSPSKPRPPTSNSPLKKKERTMGDSASTTSSSTVPSPRSLLHPSVASVHGKKEAAVIMSNFTVLRCSDNTGNTLTKVAKNRSPTKQNDHEKKKGGKDKKNVVSKSQDSPFCRRTTLQLTNPEVRGRKFTMFNGMPQRALQKRSIRRSPDHPSKQTANCEHRDGRSAEVNARTFRTEDTPSKFIQKFGANRMTPSTNMAKEGHRYCKVPTFGYARDNVPGQPPSSPNRMRSATPASKSTSPLRRVVDISEQAMNSLVNEAIREKKSKQDDSGGDIVKSVQRHFNERLKTQRRSPACDVYARFIPIQVCQETGKEKGMIRPSSCPAPRLNTPTETVFNILETLPTSRPYPTPPPPSSPSGRPPADKVGSPTGTGRAATATGISGRNVMNANRTTHEMAKGWDTAYRLERKISDTVKRATYVHNMRNEQRTRAWVEDMTTVYAPK